MVLLFAYSFYPIRPALWSKLLGLQIISLFFSVYLIFTFRKKSIFIPKSPIIIVYGLFIISLLPGCLLAVNTALAWSEYAKILSFFFIFLMAYIVNSQYSLRDYFLKGLLIFILFSILVAVLQLVFLVYSDLPADWFILVQKFFGDIPASADIHQKTYYLKSLFAHRNLFAQILLLTLPFIGFIAYGKNGFWKYLAFFTIILMIIALVFLYVRSVWVIGSISILIGIILMFATSGKSIIKTRKSLLSLIVIAFVFAISFILIQKSTKIKETFTKQSDWIKNASYGSANERLRLWQSTIPMIKDNALHGIGPNNWGIIIPKYLKHELRDVSSGNYTQFQRPHNDYLQMIAEYGIIAFLLFATVIIWTVILLFKKLIRSQSQEENFWIISLILFFVIYAGISFFSFPKERVEHQLLLALALAISLSVGKTDKLTNKWHISKPIVIPVILVLLWLPLVALSILMLQSDINIKKAYEYRANGDITQYKYFEKARQLFYNIDPNGTPIDWYISYQYSSLGNMLMTERYLRSALAAHPYHKHSLNDLGTIIGIKQDNATAEKLYLQALDIAPSFVDANVNMAIIKTQMADYNSAWYYLSKCDTSNYHSYYRPAINEVCLHLGIELYNKIEPSDSLFASTISRILQDPEWIWLCHKHAIENNCTLMQQFVDEAVYVLLEVEKEISKETAEIIKNKY